MEGFFNFKNLKVKKLLYLPFVFYLFIGQLYELGAIDKAITQWVYLNIVNILSICLIIIQREKDLDFKEISSKKEIKLFFYFLISLSFSMFYSSNISESFIKIFRWLTLLITTINLVAIFIILKPKIKVLSSLIVVSLIADFYFSYQAYFQFIKYTEYSFNLANYLKGVTGNKNITAASFVIRLPFIFYMFKICKPIFLRILFWLLGISTIFLILLLSARASIISLILYFFVLLFFEFRNWNNIKNKKSIINFVLLVSIFLIPIVINEIIISNDNKISLTNRITTLNTEDSSTKERLRYYAHSLKRIYENPIIGVGLGNWKIKSIEYDKKNIQSYIVPYHVHNDFLEITAESGIFALLLYLSLFFIVAKKVFQIIFLKIIQKEFYYFGIAILLSGIGFFIDSMLNFPHARPIVMVMFCFLLAFSSLNLFQQQKENEKK